jgi:hypothetical protein
MRPFIAAIIFIFLPLPSPAQDGAPPPSGSTFLPGGTLFPPLRANFQEPRFGVRKEAGTSRLKLDIGSSIDILEYRPDTSGTRLRLGAEFFTYALTTSAQGLRLQVDAVDGFFGGHVVYVAPGENGHLLLRLRLLHISGHLVDGHWNWWAKTWLDNKLPNPYTRNFAEIVALYAWSGPLVSLAVYSGFTYAALVRPDNLARFGTLHGFEAHTTGLTGQVGGKPFCLYAADNFSVNGIPAYYGTNNLEVGVKFGAWDGTGVRLYGSYYHGLEPFSQYYDVRTDQWGIGFAFDVW